MWAGIRKQIGKIGGAFASNARETPENPPFPVSLPPPHEGGARTIVSRGRTSARTPSYPFTHSTCRSVWTISTRSACAAMTASMSL
jgi:hypothetical protein